MTGKPVLAASASENVLFPDPASPVNDDSASQRQRGITHRLQCPSCAVCSAATPASGDGPMTRSASHER